MMALPIYSFFQQQPGASIVFIPDTLSASFYKRSSARSETLLTD
jgi:hypothetical protein